jgi:hypothetical protein
MKLSSGLFLIFAAAIVSQLAACASQQTPAATPAVAGTPSTDATCNIDARKMCAAIDKGAASTSSSQPPLAQSYGSAAMPDSIDFQIPAGPEVRLMCYFDPQHVTVARADATPKTPLDANAVKYLKEQGFCVSNP